LPSEKIFRKSPLPPFFKGGDFRVGPAKQDFFTTFRIFYFDRPGDESRTLGTKPIFSKSKIDAKI